MSRSATTAGADRLLHCSPERTLFTTRDPGTGEAVVCKVFLRGSLADAEREVAVGRALAGLDVARYLAAAVDGASNRPCVTMALHDGLDLDRLVADEGAVPAHVACRLLAPVARTLAAMHTRRDRTAPRGTCHGDVKPKNLLRTPATTLLLDFEHARPIAAAGAVPNRAGFTGGTRSFAPPEADRGAPADATFDVFGLGATLRWLLDGGQARRLPQDPGLDLLLSACTAEAPGQRPSAATVAEALTELAATLERDPAEAVLAHLAAAELPAATAALAALADGPRRRALQRLADRCARIQRRLPGLLRIPTALPTEPASLRRELATTERVLRHFPRHLPTLRWQRHLREAAGRLLTGAAAHCNTLHRSEEFAEAIRWIDEALGLARRALGLPGGLPMPFDEDPRSAGLLHRDPIAFLQLLRTQTLAAAEELQAEVAEITRAEQALDLQAAELAVERMAARYGGTSPTAARQRDQLHRLGFYLDRVARAHANVDRLSQLWDAVALRPLADFVGACAAASPLPQRNTARGDGPSGLVGLRSLQVTLVNLVEEFPHVGPQAVPALDTLTTTLAQTTDQSWDLLAEAQQNLQTVPVPVRPLQIVLGRIDTFRILEAFVDRPGRPRSQLQDGIESLRLGLEQARATRDRLAQGAEQALARGHWTTGLFDMERAVAGVIPSEDPESPEMRRLHERLAEVRRRKQEVDAAVRRNVELTTRYGLLQDDPGSTFAARLQLLEERRDCLQFLGMHLPAERSALYGRDLREVETQIALERAGLAENELDGTDEPRARLRLARATLDRLADSASPTDPDAEPPGRVRRLLDHWRTVTAQCQREVERLHAEAEARRSQRRRLWAIATGAALVSLTAIAFAARPWWRGEALAAQHAPASAAAPVAALATRAEQLGPALAPTARALAASLQQLVVAPATADLDAWLADFGARLLDCTDAGAATDAAARTFVDECWQVGLRLAFARAEATRRPALVARATGLAETLGRRGLRGVTPPGELAATSGQ